jgi:hypothetical protein
MSEVMLWRSVIIQALDDVFAKEYWVQRDAITWFFRNSKDFNMVCDFAGVSPCRVRAQAFEKIMKGR